MNTSELTHWLTAYPLRTGAIALILLGLVTAAPKMQSQVSTAQAEQKIRLAGQYQARLNEAETDYKAQLLQVRARLAESRYQAGVIFVVDPNKPEVPTTITEGLPVAQQGSTTGAVLPDGTIVGDRNGNTGVILGGVVTDVAYTGNPQIVRDAYDQLINPEHMQE
jgi:type II secretory pathway pseudopilin PulG